MTFRSSWTRPTSPPADDPVPPAPGRDPALLHEPAAAPDGPAVVPAFGTPDPPPGRGAQDVGQIITALHSAVRACELSAHTFSLGFDQDAVLSEVTMHFWSHLKLRDGHRLFRMLDADGAVLGAPISDSGLCLLVNRVDQLGITLRAAIPDPAAL